MNDVKDVFVVFFVLAMLTILAILLYYKKIKVCKVTNRNIKANTGYDNITVEFIVSNFNDGVLSEKKNESDTLRNTCFF